MTERAAARVHYNLLDSHVAICTPQLLVVFADNFDYQEMAHLIKGVMERDEVAPAPHAHAARLTFLCPPPLFFASRRFFSLFPRPHHAADVAEGVRVYIQLALRRARRRL